MIVRFSTTTVRFRTIHKSTPDLKTIILSEGTQNETYCSIPEGAWAGARLRDCFYNRAFDYFGKLLILLVELARIELATS